MALIQGMKVPVPPDGHANPDGKVVRVLPAGPGERWPRKRLIGKVLKGEGWKTEDGIQLMIPNDAYRKEYPEEFEKYRKLSGVDDTLPPETVHVGLYLLVLGTAYQLGLYPLLCVTFPVPLANAVMDLAMYCTLCRDTDFSKMASALGQELLFSGKTHDEDWYAGVFQMDAAGDATDAAFSDRRVRAFMRRWAALRVASGRKDACLTLNGTRIDWGPAGDPEAQPGQAKTGKSVKMKGVLAAVEAGGDSRGMPLAYWMDPGCRDGAVSIQDLLRFFTGVGLEPKYLLAGDGVPYGDVRQLCDALALPFQQTMDADSEVFATMFEAYQKTVFWRETHWIEGTTSIYGISRDGVPLGPKDSQNPDGTVCAALFFDGMRSNAVWEKYHDALNQALLELKERLQMFQKSGAIGKALSREDDDADPERSPAESGNRTDQEKVLAALANADIAVPEEYQDVMELRYDPDTKAVTAAIRRDALQEKHRTLGYSCMVSSVPKTAQEMADDAMLCEDGEAAFRAMKAAWDGPADHSQEGNWFRATFFVCFVADIIRNGIVGTFQRYEEESGCPIDTDAMLRSFSDLCYTRSGAGYRYAGEMSDAQREILAYLGISAETCKTLDPLLRATIQEESLEILAAQQRELPVVPQKRARGRPKGSLNKPKGDGTKKSKFAEKENAKGKRAEEKQDAAPAAGSTDSDDGIDIVRSTETATPAETEPAERPLDTAEDRPTVGMQPAETAACRTVPAAVRAHEAEERSGLETGESKAEDRPQEKTNRTGTQYKKTRRQDDYDRDLAEKTGIDIMGNPPPRPWSAAIRAAETRRRNRLRKEAEKRWREICAAVEPEPDQ